MQLSSVYLSQAISLRSDLKAASTRAQAGTILMQGAETPTCVHASNLKSSVYFSSLGETVQSRFVGPSQTASVQVEKPYGNNLFAGQLAERRADLAQRGIELTDLTRQVRLNVLAATGSLQDAVEAVRQAEAAVRFYQSTTDAEIQRFQIGEATLIDTVQTQQQQIDALLALVSARQQVAELVAQLRFQTGTLLQGGAVTRPGLIALPGPVSKVALMDGVIRAGVPTAARAGQRCGRLVPAWVPSTARRFLAACLPAALASGVSLSAQQLRIPGTGLFEATQFPAPPVPAQAAIDLSSAVQLTVEHNAAIARSRETLRFDEGKVPRGPRRVRSVVGVCPWPVVYAPAGRPDARRVGAAKTQNAANRRERLLSARPGAERSSRPRSRASPLLDVPSDCVSARISRPQVRCLISYERLPLRDPRGVHRSIFPTSVQARLTRSCPRARTRARGAV